MSVAQLTADLVAIDSVNPSLVPGGAGEAEIAGFVRSWAIDHGLEAEVLEGTPGRPTVLVTARGTGGGKTLLLCGHLDTVNVDGMREPHRPRREGDRLHGRGTYDMKGGVAAALIAARDALRHGIAGDVVVACVADEEHASLGVQEALAHVRADAAVVTEPTELEVVVAHKGFVWADVTVEGRAAHGSRPHLGVDAIVHAAPVLAGVGALDERLATTTSHPLLERASVHTGTIAGGAERSSYPAACTVSIERRTLPGESRRTFEGELEVLLDDARAAVPGLRGGFEVVLERAPFTIDPGHELVGRVRRAATTTLGRTPALAGASYWADAAFIAAAGIPTVMFGPAGEGAHADVEWVSVASLEGVAATLTGLATAFCA